MTSSDRVSKRPQRAQAAVTAELSASVSKRPKSEQAAVTAELDANAEILREMMYEHDKDRQAWRTSLLEQKTKASELQTELKEAKEELKAAKEEAKKEEAEAETAAKESKEHFRKWIRDLKDQIQELGRVAEAKTKLLKDKIQELGRVEEAKTTLLFAAQNSSDRWRDQFQMVNANASETEAKESKEHFRKWVTELQRDVKELRQESTWQQNKIQELRKVAEAKTELLCDAQSSAYMWRDKFQKVVADIADLADITVESATTAALIHVQQDIADLHTRTKKLDTTSTPKL
jgi:hypothetical protein